MPRLTGASLKTRGEDLVLTYSVDDDLPDTGHWLLSTTVIGGEDGPIHQYGTKVVDGSLSSVFDFRHSGEVGQRNFSDVTPSRVGTTWTVVFPLDEDAVMAGAKWHADLDINGQGSGRVEGTV